MPNKPIVGVADHCGWAVLVTVADGQLIDRRRVELVEPGLPSLPHHHEAQALPIKQAVALIHRVQASAEKCAARSLDALAAEVPHIAGITLRKCQPLPETIAERITNYRAQCAADSIMYRNALAKAAAAKGWQVRWYETKTVQAEAAKVLGRDIEALLKETQSRIGPPWQKDHRTAMAAAIAAG
jgi:hypothetical protein